MSYVFERLNERRDGGRESGVDAGFTLIELMVVLLIMAILLAIAIPTFLGVSGSANDRAAQSNLNTALTNAKSYYDSNQQSFPTSAAFVTAITAQEPSLSWTTGPSTGSGVISTYIDSTSSANVVFAALSNTNTCWYLVDNESSVTAGDTDTTFSALPTTPSDVQSAGTWYGGVAGQNKTSCTAASSATLAVKWNATGVAGFPSITPT